MDMQYSQESYLRKNVLITKLLHFIFLIFVCAALTACNNSGGGSDSSNDGSDTNDQQLTLETPPSTNGQVQIITNNDDLAAAASTPVVVYNNAGNGMAVWTVQTGNGSKILASYYDATSGIWSAEQTVLAKSYPLLGSLRFQLADDQYLAGTDSKFVLVWTDDDNMYSGEFDIASQSWSVNLLVSNQTARSGIPRITSDGADFLVVWRDRLTASVISKRYTNSAWQNDETVIQSWDSTSDLHYSIAPNVLLASIDNISVAFWYAITNNTTNNANTYTLYASVLDTNTVAPEWSAPVSLNAQGIDGNINPFEIKAGASRFLLSWAQNTSQTDDTLFIYSKTFDTTTGQWSDTVQVNDTALSYPYYPIFSASIGDAGYGYSWIDEGADITDSISNTLTRLYVNANNTGWLPVTTLSSDSIFATQASIATNNLGFAVQWFEASAQNGRLRYINRYLNGNWENQPAEFPINGSVNPYLQTIIGHNDSFYAIYAIDTSNQTETTLFLQSTTAAENWKDPVSFSSWIFNFYERSQLNDIYHVISANNIYFTWVQFAEINADSRIYPFIADITATTIEAKNLASSTVGASGISSLLATNGTGHTLAFAMQYDNGFYQRYASIRKAGEWSSPIQLDQESRTIQSRYPVSRFIVENAVAANGSQFCAIWDHAIGIYSRVYDGDNWEAEQLLSDVRNPGNLKLIAHQQGFLAAWEEYDRNTSTRSIQSAYYDNGTWSVDTMVEIAGDDRTAADNSHIALDAASTDEFIIAWVEKNPDGSKSVKALHKTGATATVYAIMTFIPAHMIIKELKVTALSAGDYLVSYINTNTVTTSTDDALEIYRFTPQQQTPWNNIYNEQQSDNFYALASTNQYVALVYVNGLDVYGTSYSLIQTSWTQPLLLDSNLDGSVYALNMASNGDQVAVALDGYGNSLAQYIVFDGASWSDPVILSDQADTVVRRNPHISPYRDNFGITWSETNLSTDASLSYIAAKMGGIE